MLSCDYFESNVNCSEKFVSSLNCHWCTFYHFYNDSLFCHNCFLVRIWHSSFFLSLWEAPHNACCPRNSRWQKKRNRHCKKREEDISFLRTILKLQTSQFYIIFLSIFSEELINLHISGFVSELQCESLQAKQTMIFIIVIELVENPLKKTERFFVKPLWNNWTKLKNRLSHTRPLK